MAFVRGWGAINYVNQSLSVHVLERSREMCPGISGMPSYAGRLRALASTLVSKGDRQMEPQTSEHEANSREDYCANLQR